MTGVIYGVEPNGDLQWYHHTGRDTGQGSWEGAKKVGTGWSAFDEVLGAGDGVLYGVAPFIAPGQVIVDPAHPGGGHGAGFRPSGGDLIWYHHTAWQDGGNAWDPRKKVGTGWNGFTHILPGGGGVVYGIQPNGDLLWYRHTGRDAGVGTWEGPLKIGNGWNFKQVFAGGAGVIYGIKEDGDLLWYRHTGRDTGQGTWEGPNTVGNGWRYRHVFSDGDGVIYGVDNDGALFWYHHLGWNTGANDWAPRAQVGTGWQNFSHIFAAGESGAARPPRNVEPIGAIAETYRQLGGHDSWLGLPTEAEQDFSDGGRVSTFEHGAIYWWPGLAPVALGDVVIRYKGLFAFGITDSIVPDADEPYVIFGVIPPPPQAASTVMSQIYDDVDAGDARPDAVELYRGIPYGLGLGIALFEHDEGDPNKYRDQVQVGVAEAGNGVAAGCGAVPYVGPFLAPVCKALWDKYSDKIVEAVNQLLGTDDDLIEKSAWNLSAKDVILAAGTPLKQYYGIEWHLESKLLEGLGASYKVYVDVQPV